MKCVLHFYLIRCFTNFSWLLTEGMFLWITGTCPWMGGGRDNRWASEQQNLYFIYYLKITAVQIWLVQYGFVFIPIGDFRLLTSIYKHKTTVPLFRIPNTHTRLVLPSPSQEFLSSSSPSTADAWCSSPGWQCEVYEAALGLLHTCHAALISPPEPAGRGRALDSNRIEPLWMIFKW